MLRVLRVSWLVLRLGFGDVGAFLACKQAFGNGIVQALVGDASFGNEALYAVGVLA